MDELRKLTENLQAASSKQTPEERSVRLALKKTHEAYEDAKKRVNSLRYDLNQEARQQVLATVPTWFALCLDNPPGTWATSGVTLRQRVAATVLCAVAATGTWRRS